MKIKEEPIDTTSNTTECNTTEDYMSLRNYYSLIDHDYHYRDKPSLSETDTLHKDINNTEDRHSNDDFVHSNDIKPGNIESRNVKPKQNVHNTLLQLKKQKCSNEVFNNKDTNVLRTTTGNVRRKRKQQNILDCKIKKQCTKKSIKEKLPECNICFRTFTSLRNREFHRQYYEASDSICRICKKHFPTNEKLQSNMCDEHNEYVLVHINRYSCNFCSRTFKKKPLLQSHLFHSHSKLIYFNNTTKHETSKPENVNTSPKNDTSRTSTNEESYSDSLKKDDLKSKKINTTLINDVNKSLNNMMDTDKSTIENSFNNEMSPTKKLRQPTLTEYLELCKKKRDIKLSPNKLNLMKDDLSVCTSHHDEQIEEDPRPKLLKHNHQIDSTKSDNLPKQTTLSIQEQTTVKQEIHLSKKPFVRLHADVEMMKSFLEKLSDVDKTTADGTNDSVVCDRDVPYRLRSLSGVETDSNSRMKKNKISKKSQVNIEFSSKKEQNIDIDKVNPEIGWKIIIPHLKCKECTIPLIRCDEQPRTSHQVSVTDVTKNTSLTTQCNSTSLVLQESNVQNKIMLKDLEISLERLTAVPTTKVKIELDVEKHNSNYFSCKVCKESFPSKLAKRTHIKSTHIAYMSSICNARYTLKHKLLQHYLSEHLFKQNQCCICYMLLPDNIALKQHLTIHCLKYIQKENDQYPIDIELKCSLTEKPCKCLDCNETFSSQLFLEIHQSCCVAQEEMEKIKEDFVEEANEHPKNIPELQQENTDEYIVTCDEKINLDDSCKSLNSDCIKEKLNEPQISVHNKKELEINEANRNCLANNNLIEKKIESVNKSQGLKKLSKNNNSTTSNQNTTKVKLNELATRTMTYPCDICGKQFHNSKNLEIHIRTFNFTTDICPMCGTGFSSKRLLQTHITAAHVPLISKTYNFHCVFCNQGFFKKHDLRPHILHLHGQQVLSTLTRNHMCEEKSNHPSVIHSTMCNICNLVFETHDRYIEHRMYYYKNHMFTCSLCDKDFQGMYMFHHHNKLVHYSEDKRKSYSFICEICKEGFNHESHFYSHNMHIHSNELNVFEIGKEEKHHFDYSLEEKIRNISTDQQKQNKQPSKEYTCEICELKCADLYHMAKHKEFYSNDGDFRCDKCNRRYRTFYLLDQHRKLTHLYRNMYNGHTCHICGEVLETVILLKCHEKHFHSNTTDNNTNNWKNGDQILSSNITNEIMEHLYKSKNICNITEYNCLFCDMKFLTASTIQTHIVHVHMDDMIAKRSVLKLTLPITNNDYIQKQFQFFDINPALSSSSTSSTISSMTSSTTSSATSSAKLPSESSSTTSSAKLPSSSEDNSTQLLQTSTIQRFNNAHSNILSDTTKTNMTDKTTSDKTTELLNNFKPACSKNNTDIEKTPVSVIPCTNTSKNISTVNTIASNTKSNMNNLITSPVNGRMIGTYGTLNIYENNITVRKSEVYIKSGGVYLKSGVLDETRIRSGFKKMNKLKTTSVTPNSKNNKITNQTSKSMNGHSYSCPLCPLEYPSLIFFHGHLKYAHPESIRGREMIIPQSSSFQGQKTSIIGCLLCPLTFTDETKYKQHLRISHTYYVYIPNSEMTKTSNMHNPLTQSKNKTNIVEKSIIPETITVEDDDDEPNIKNTSDQQTAEVTTMPDQKIQNDKIGKLRVKPFAKIIENLSTESALKFLN